MEYNSKIYTYRFQEWPDGFVTGFFEDGIHRVYNGPYLIDSAQQFKPLSFTSENELSEFAEQVNLLWCCGKHWDEFNINSRSWHNPISRTPKEIQEKLNEMFLNQIKKLNEHREFN